MAIYTSTPPRVLSVQIVLLRSVSAGSGEASSRLPAQSAFWYYENTFGGEQSSRVISMAGG